MSAHRPGAASRRSLPACDASSAFGPPVCLKTYIRADQFIGGGSLLLQRDAPCGQRTRASVRPDRPAFAPEIAHGGSKAPGGDGGDGFNPLVVRGALGA